VPRKSTVLLAATAVAATLAAGPVAASGARSAG